MGFNQHTRGVWCSNLSLQPAPAHRQDLHARQQPVLAHRTAFGLRHRARGRHVLASPARGHGGGQSGASREGRGDLGLAGGHDPATARLSRGAAEPDAEGRQAQRVLGAGQQQHAGRAQHGARRAIPAIAIPTTSSSSPKPIRRSRRLPPTSCCRPRCGSRRKARTATRSAARSSGTSWSTAPGEARSDLWQLVEFSKRFKVEEVWPAELIAKKPEMRGKTLYDILYRNGKVDRFPVVAGRDGLRQRRGEGLRLLPPEGTVRGVRRVRSRPRPRPRAFRHVPRGARPALAGRQRQGDALALPRGQRSVREGRHRLPVLRQSRRPRVHLRAALRAGGGVARQGVSVLAVDRPRARALAFGVDDAPRAGALPRVPERRRLHASRRRARRSACAAVRRCASSRGAAR